MIIGISGHKQSGKNTVASMLQYILSNRGHFCDLTYETWDYWNSSIKEGHLSNVDPNDLWQIKSFAQKLKAAVGVLFSVDPKHFEKEEFKDSHIPCQYGNYTWREILQIVGTDLFRNQFHKDFWINSTLADYDTKQKWIISDVRFQNEADAIINLGGVILRVERGVYNRDLHESETALNKYPKFFQTIDNDSTLVELFNKCLTLCQNLQKI